MASIGLQPVAETLNWKELGTILIVIMMWFSGYFMFITEYFKYIIAMDAIDITLRLSAMLILVLQSFLAYFIYFSAAYLWTKELLSSQNDILQQAG